MISTETFLSNESESVRTIKENLRSDVLSLMQWNERIEIGSSTPIQLSWSKYRDKNW